MSVAIPKVRVGDPLRHEALSVFPLSVSSATVDADSVHCGDCWEIRPRGLDRPSCHPKIEPNERAGPIQLPRT